MAVIKWVLIGLITFVVFVGIFMGVMIYTTPKNTAALKDSLDITSKIIKEAEKQKIELDNKLIEELKAAKSKFRQLKIKYDSLKTASFSHASKLELKDKEIEKLTSSLADKSDRNARAKDLAKTLSSMKVTKIAPILSKLDDQTVIAIYQQMGKTDRKNILLGLSGDRAAVIAKKLIN